jgi:hypothetical protein
MRHSATARRKKAAQDLVVIALRFSGWLATSALATLGIATLFFLVLGGFTLDGLMLHLDNLASRFVAADASRRGQFAAISFGVMLTGFVLIAFFRRASLISAFLVAGDDQ